MMSEEMISIQKNEYKATICCEPAEPLLRRTVALSSLLFYGVLKWIRSVFEEGSKVIQRCALLRDISMLAYRVGLLAPRAYVLEMVN